MDPYIKRLVNKGAAKAATAPSAPPKTNVVDFRSAAQGKPLGAQEQELRAAASMLLERIQYMRQAGITFGGARDLYDVLGYDRIITNRQYRDRYARGGIAGRIVDAMPNATWRGDVEVLETEDSKVNTTFEKAWADLDQRLQIKAKLLRVDKLAGQSTYAVLLIGAAGPTPLEQELPKGGNNPNRLLYLTPFSGGGGPGGDANSRAMAVDADCTIQSFETDVKSIRFGLPKSYQLKRTDIMSPMLSRGVHWTRIIHVAENCLQDEVYGQPALERVWNLLDDLDKVTGGGAEAFWLRANQGLHLDINKDMQLPDANDAKKALKEQSEEYKHQLTRWIRTRGVNVKVLGSEVANFANPADAILTQIAGAKSMPKRILTGSEMGELASSQDRDNWKDQINGRQLGYAGPYIVRPLVDRLVTYGYLPTPSKGPLAYIVKWPHIQTLTEQEKADGAAKWAEINKTAGVTVFTAEEIREKWYQMAPTVEADTEAYKAELALKMATVNKTQGVTIFTSAEIRKTCYGWKPLTPAEEIPIGAPERISVTTPPGQDGDATSNAALPRPQTRPAVPALVAAEGHAELLSVLEEAVRTNNTSVIDRILGLKHLEDHKFSSIQLQMPTPIADVLRQMEQSLTYEDLDFAAGGTEDDLHVTVKYGLETDDASLVQEVVQGMGAIPLTLGETEVFPGPQYDVLYVRVVSQELEALNVKITDTLDVTNTHPKYIPHVTLAYLKPGMGAKYKGLTQAAGLTFQATDLRFSSSTDEKTDISLVGERMLGGPGSGNFGHGGKGKEPTHAESSSLGDKADALQKAAEKSGSKEDYAKAADAHKAAADSHKAGYRSTLADIHSKLAEKMGAKSA